MNSLVNCKIFFIKHTRQLITIMSSVKCHLKSEGGGGGEMSDDENNEWAAGELMFFDLINDEQSEENIWACARHRRYGDASP